jgi:LysR family glycine cleavage system transcriptional activator
MLTYYSLCRLSPRLTQFFESHPGANLRIESISSLENLKSIQPDLAIQWGMGEWPGTQSELLFNCPAVPTANPDLAAQVREMGLKTALKTLPLLGDSSGNAGWKVWHAAAGLDYIPNRTSLTIPGLNSRV